MVRHQDKHPRSARALLNNRFRTGSGAPDPGIAKPEMRQKMQRRPLRAAVESLDADGDVFGRDLGVFDHDVEIAVIVEDARIKQLQLRSRAEPLFVFLDETGIGVLSLRVLVQEPHVGVCWRVIKIEVVFLDILAVVALVGCQTKQAFLEDRILDVPEGRGKNQELEAIAETGDAVLAPAISLAPGQVMRQVGPGVAIGAIVFANGCPGAVAHIGPPAPPARDVVTCAKLP